MKDMIKRIREEREGFTLAELLIVVAIIAVLVAIAIPVFNSQLEKSREATDAANLRSAYAVASAEALTGKTVAAGPVKLTQTQSGFTTEVKDSTIGGKKLGDLTGVEKDANFYVTVTSDGTVNISASTPGADVTVIDPVTGESSTSSTSGGSSN